MMQRGQHSTVRCPRCAKGTVTIYHWYFPATHDDPVDCGWEIEEQSCKCGDDDAEQFGEEVFEVFEKAGDEYSATTEETIDTPEESINPIPEVKKKKVDRFFSYRKTVSDSLGAVWKAWREHFNEGQNTHSDYEAECVSRLTVPIIQQELFEKRKQEVAQGYGTPKPEHPLDFIASKKH